jgi:short-subunit dehydrogenase
MPDTIMTGASLGIGRALALALATQGARLVLTARDFGRLSSLAGEIEHQGDRAFVVPTDLGSVATGRSLGGS